MPVHNDSKIDTWLNDYWPDLYDSLTSKENWTFSNTSGSERTYAESAFENLNTNLVNYKNTLRQESGENIVSNLIESLYSNYAMQQNFGVGNLNLANYDYTSTFNINNFGTLTLSRPVDYYNDISGPSPITSTRLENDIGLVGSSVSNENTYLADVATPALTDDFKNKISDFLFVDPPRPTNPVGKQQIGEFIFETLGYKYVYTYLNVGSLALPPYIDI